MLSRKYYRKPTSVKAHTRNDPRIGKRVNVDSYTRNQRYRHKDYSTISRAEALRYFDQKSDRSKAIDLSRTSKEVFDYPNKSWLENMGKSDVKGIDTKDAKKGNYIKEKLDERIEIQELKEIKELMAKQISKKTEREDLLGWEITDLEQERKCLMNSNRRVALMTNKSFKESYFDKNTKDREDIQFDINKKSFRLSDKDQKFYDFKLNNGKEVWYEKEHIDRAMKSFENPRIYLDKNNESNLIIQGDNFTYAIAPRIRVEDPRWWSSESLIPGGYSITPKKYKEKMKMTKAEMVRKGNLDKALEKKSKDAILYEYLLKQKGKV